MQDFKFFFAMVLISSNEGVGSWRRFMLSEYPCSYIFTLVNGLHGL